MARDAGLGQVLQQELRLVHAALGEALANVSAVPREASAEMREAQLLARAVVFEAHGIVREAIERGVDRRAIGGIAEPRAVETQRQHYPHGLDDLGHDLPRFGIRLLSARRRAREHDERADRPETSNR